MSFSFRKKIAAALTAVALALGVGFVATAPAAQADEVTFDPQATTEVGKKSDDVALDAKRNRLYVVDSGEGKPTDKTSKVTWLNSADNTAAAESINLEEGVAKKLLLSNDGDTLFVVHSKSTNAISIINLNDNSVKKIDKLVASPHSINGVVQGSASDKLYIYERTAINTLNPTTLEKGTKIALPDSMTYIDPPKAGVRPHPFASNQIDKMVYDSTRNYFWTIVTNANRSKGFVTVFDLNKNAWREDIKLDLREKTFTNGVLGGVPSNLAFDKAHGALHIVVKKWTGNPNPESWPGTDEARMVTYDIETGNTLGDSFVSLRGSGEIEVNPVTHEVYVAIPANNTLAVISPKTWTAKTVHDYNEAIAINGVNNANTFGLAIDSEKGKVYTSHPAGRGNTKVSVLSRTGETPAYTDRKPTRIGLVVEEEAAVNWHGPAAPEVTPAAAGVCEPTISDINFNWGLSGYVRDYFSLVYRYGDNVKKNDDRSATWTAGKGRYDEKTGAGELIWPGGINYAGYGNAGFNYGNPKLEVRADKTASLSMDIEIHYGMPNVNPKGFNRVNVANFKNLNLTKEGNKVTITGTPEFDANTYPGQEKLGKTGAFPQEFIDFFDENMRAWWFRTGLSRDGIKPGLPITVTFNVAENPCPAVQTLTLEPNTAKAGEQVTAKIAGFKNTDPVSLKFKGEDAELASIVPAENGGTAQFTLAAEAAAGEKTVVATQAATGLTAEANLTIAAKQNTLVEPKYVAPAPITQGTAGTVAAPTFTEQGNDTAANKPENTAFAIDPGLAGFTIDAATGAITVADTVAAGDHNVTVVVTYQDGSKDTVQVPVTVKNPVYTVTFNTNGGTPDVAAQQVEKGNKATAPTATPTKEGHKFLGWFTEAEGTTQFNFEAPVTANAIAHAKWEKNQYTVTFNANGGSGAPADVQVAHGEGFTKPNQEPTLAGHTFAGWTTDSAATATSADYVFSTPVTGALTLYAKWTKNQYTVTFNANSGALAADTQSSVKVAYGDKVAKPATDPTRAGYAFAGWFKDAAGANAFDFANTMVDADTTLYAKWTRNTHTVTFKHNDGVTADVVSSTNDEGKVAAPTAPTRAGYTFVKWTTDEAGATEHNFDTVLTESKTVYAQWQRNTYTVKFDANGGAGAPADATTSAEGKIAKPATEPTREGHAFAGWFKEAAGTTQFDFDAVVTENTTAFAKWTKNRYDVTFNANGGENAPAAVTVEHGATAAEPAAKPTRAGHTFAGWATDAAGTANYNFANPVTGAVTLYAKWTKDPEPVKVFTVTFDSKGGSAVPAANTNAEGKVTKPVDPTKDGHKFLGWTTDEAGANAFNFDTAVTADTKLYAKWEKAAEPVQPQPQPKPMVEKVEGKVDAEQGDNIVEQKQLDKAQQGKEVTLVAAGFKAGEEVTLTVKSEPVVVGTKPADANGKVSFTWAVPADYKIGKHRAVFSGKLSGDAEKAFFVEKAAPLKTKKGDGATVKLPNGEIPLVTKKGDQDGNAASTPAKEVAEIPLVTKKGDADGNAALNPEKQVAEIPAQTSKGQGASAEDKRSYTGDLTKRGNADGNAAATAEKPVAEIPAQTSKGEGASVPAQPNYAGELTKKGEGVTAPEKPTVLFEKITVSESPTAAQAGGKAETVGLANTGSAGQSALLAIAMLTVLAGGTLLGGGLRKRMSK